MENQICYYRNPKTGEKIWVAKIGKAYRVVHQVQTPSKTLPGRTFSEVIYAAEYSTLSPAQADFAERCCNVAV